MELTLYGRVAGPTVATVGTWDPFARTHDDLLVVLTEHARSRGLSTTAVLLDPAPQALVAGPTAWTVYNDARTRLALLRERVDAVAYLAFGEADLEAGAAELLDVLTRELTLAELWVRWKQSLGSGTRGDARAIALAAYKRGITLRKLPARAGEEEPALARKQLANGAVQEAARRVGRPPTLARPDAEAPVRLAWRPGRYRAQAWTSSGSKAGEGGSIDLDLVWVGDGMSSFDWPSPSIDQLVFTRGPGDDSGESAYRAFICECNRSLPSATPLE